MQKYVKAVKHPVETFNHFTLKQVPGSENKQVDTLSKLTSIAFELLKKGVGRDPFRRSKPAKLDDTIFRLPAKWRPPRRLNVSKKNKNQITSIHHS